MNELAGKPYSSTTAGPGLPIEQPLAVDVGVTVVDGSHLVSSRSDSARDRVSGCPPSMDGVTP